MQFRLVVLCLSGYNIVCKPPQKDSMFYFMWEVPVTGHGVFGGKLQWKCININPMLIMVSTKRYMWLRFLVRRH